MSNIKMFKVDYNDVLKGKLIIIKELPSSYFPNGNQDKFPVGRVFEKMNLKLYQIYLDSKINFSEYVVTLAEWRDIQINNILK